MKWVNDNALDAMLDYIATATRLDVVSDAQGSAPTNLTNSLANVTLTAGDGNGDFTIANGDTSGRKITVAQQANIPVTADGVARQIVLSVGGTILLSTNCTEQQLYSGNTVTVPAFEDEVADPS